MEGSDVQAFSPVAIDHARNPRNQGALADYDGHACITGTCGDTMEIWLRVREGRVDKVSFITDGCGSSLACGSMATCLADGKPLEEAAVIDQQDVSAALGGLPPEVEHCALLAASTLQAACGDYLGRQKDESEEAAAGGERPSRLDRVRHKVMVLSGKGGVGKSTVAVNLAMSWMMTGKRVGLLDADLHGPSIPTMLGLEHAVVLGGERELLPVEAGGLKVMSLGFLLSSPDDAVIWRGPLKASAIRQFLHQVAWGELDCLVIDSPPGTGDEPLSVCQSIGRLDGAVIVTTPQQLAAVDVRKAITFCRQLEVPVLGVVENMSGFVCPRCGEVTPILGEGGGKRIAEDMQVPFLGSIPLDPRIAEAGDHGESSARRYAVSPVAAVMRDVLQAIVRRLEAGQAGDAEPPASGAGGVKQPEPVEQAERAEPMQQEKKEEKPMRIAIPLAGGKLSAHFGHCEEFALVDVDPASRQILGRENLAAPPHQPGLLPPWLAERGANLIIAGGMGQRAQGLFAAQGIQVLVGAPAETPERLVSDYLAGTLQVGDNVCDH